MPPEPQIQPKKISPPIFIWILLIVAALIGSFQIYRPLNIPLPGRGMDINEIHRKNIENYWKTYKNKEYGVEFKYPEYWYVLGGTKQVPIIISSTGKPALQGELGEEIIIYQDQSYEIGTYERRDIIDDILSTFKFISTSTENKI